MTEEVDARKVRYDADAALELLKGMSTLIVAKGRNVTRVDLKKNRPDDQELIALLIGPTGNLRAPTMKIGRTVLVGFQPDAWAEIFGDV